jgi:DNA-binding NtrC family response regulator
MQGHILIVEDEEAIAAFLQTALEREGFVTQWRVLQNSSGVMSSGLDSAEVQGSVSKFNR